MLGRLRDHGFRGKFRGSVPGQGSGKVLGQVPEEGSGKVPGQALGRVSRRFRAGSTAMFPAQGSGTY